MTTHQHNPKHCPYKHKCKYNVFDDLCNEIPQGCSLYKIFKLHDRERKQIEDDIHSGDSGLIDKIQQIKRYKQESYARLL